MEQSHLSEDAVVRRYTALGRYIGSAERGCQALETREPDGKAMRTLTERQSEILDFIRAYVRKHGVAPSRPEIGKGVGLTHKSTVDAHLSALMKKGWVELQPGSPRNIRLLREDLPVAPEGRIAAGEPVWAESRVTGHIPRAVAEMFTPRPDYFLTVEGDSMDRLGLTTGTLVAIKGDSEPRNGDIVVARIVDEVTLKRFKRKSLREVELSPESTNDTHRPMTIDLETTEFQVDGVYVGALIGDIQASR